MAEGSSNLPVPSPEVKPPEITPALFKEFLDNQSREIELKTREIDLDKQKDEHSFEFAKRALEAEANDRKEQREFHIHSRRNTYWFAGVCAVLFLALLLTALAMGKDAIAMEIVKATVFIVSGGAGGYAVGRNRTKGSHANNQRDSGK